MSQGGSSVIAMEPTERVSQSFLLSAVDSYLFLLVLNFKVKYF